MARRLLVLTMLAAAALLGAALPVDAHQGEAVGHVNPHNGVLEPEQWETNELQFEEGPLKEGWVFILNIAVQQGGAGVDAALVTGNTTAATWSVPADGEVHRLTTLIPETGTYVVNLSHDGSSDANATYLYFFDQSCECSGKPIPHTLLGGIVVFNADVPPADEVIVTIPEPAALGLTITAAWRTGDGADWPGDFEIIHTSDGYTRLTDTNPPVRLHEMRLDTGEGGRMYYWVEAAAFHQDKFAGPSSVMVTPLFELASTTTVAKSDGGNGAAGPGAVLGIAGGLVAALALALTRRR